MLSTYCVPSRIEAHITKIPARFLSPQEGEKGEMERTGSRLLPSSADSVGLELIGKGPGRVWQEEGGGAEPRAASGPPSPGATTAAG